MPTSEVVPLESTVLTDLDVNSTVEYIASGSTVLYSAVIDNTDNTEEVYLKLWNNTSGVSVGSTAPVYVIKVPASSEISHIFNGGVGVTFGTGVAAACVDTPGWSGSSSPINDVKFILKTN